MSGAQKYAEPRAAEPKTAHASGTTDPVQPGLRRYMSPTKAAIKGKENCSKNGFKGARAKPINPTRKAVRPVPTWKMWSPGIGLKNGNAYASMAAISATGTRTWIARSHQRADGASTGS